MDCIARYQANLFYISNEVIRLLISRIKRFILFGKMDLAMRKIMNRTFYRYTLVISITLFCSLIFLQIRGARLNINSESSEAVFFDNIYQGLTSFPLLSSFVMALLGFFIISNLIFALFDKQIFISAGFNAAEKDPAEVDIKQGAMNMGLQTSQANQNLPLNSSLSIFDAVIQCELSRLEDEVERLRANAQSIAQTNHVIESLMVRIGVIIDDTQKNIDNFHVNLPAANTLLKELDSLSVKADSLTRSIACSIDTLLQETETRTSQVSNIIKQVLLVPKDDQIPQVNECLADFDMASKLTNELALEQADIAQNVKMQLNSLSDIAKETNLKSQCIVNSMRDISNTKQDHGVKTTNANDE